MICFHLIINEFVSRPFYLTGTVPKMNIISGISAKVRFDLHGKWYDYALKEVCKGVTHRQPLITLSMSGKGELKQEQ